MEDESVWVIKKDCFGVDIDLVKSFCFDSDFVVL